MLAGEIISKSVTPNTRNYKIPKGIASYQALAGRQERANCIGSDRYPPQGLKTNVANSQNICWAVLPKARCTKNAKQRFGMPKGGFSGRVLNPLLWGEPPVLGGVGGTVPAPACPWGKRGRGMRFVADR